jgi:alkanesulfonate monooxygenase SsuD/methylene tetrahydromethanopterin reductase-like flavin-dependent oxidoreductase (luciferase family)
VELGVHLPLMPFGDEPLSPGRVRRVVDTARECGFAAVSANDHFVFQTAWLDGPTALASVIEASGDLGLATTVALSALRGPVALAKALAAIEILSGGRLIAGVGPGSSQRDYDAVGVPFDERWKRFEESVVLLRALLAGAPVPEGRRFYRVPDELALEPAPARPVPVWVGSWGSKAGLARVTRIADGWLASAYNTTPEGFAAARERLADGFPNALATMWTWVANDGAEADRVLRDVLAPLLRRDPEELGAQVCVGPPEHCAQLLARYKAAGCQRVYLWPLGDEQRQLELVASEVAPSIR